MKITRTEHQLAHQCGEFMTAPETYVHVRTRSPRNSIQSFRGARSSCGCPQDNASYTVWPDCLRGQHPNTRCLKSLPSISSILNLFKLDFFFLDLFSVSSPRTPVYHNNYSFEETSVAKNSGYMFVNKISMSQTCLYGISYQKLPDFYDQSLERAFDYSSA